MKFVILLAFYFSFAFNKISSQNLEENSEVKSTTNRLLIVVIDGFRWDYIRRFRIRSKRRFDGFRQFIRGGVGTGGGVQTEYLKSVFPSESYPAWQTINTGVYPEKHGIIGNVFFDSQVAANSGVGIGSVGYGTGSANHKYFNHIDQRSTEQWKWWQKVEPIWANAVRHNRKFAAFLWGRCDIPWQDIRQISPDFCETLYHKDDSKTLPINLDRALIKFQQGTTAAIVYEDSVGKAGENFGPLSNQTETALRRLDSAVTGLLKRLKSTNMDKEVNVVLISDHGMTYGERPLPENHSKRFDFDEHEPVSVSMDQALKKVKRMIRMVVGSGAYSMVYPVGTLKSASENEGRMGPDVRLRINEVVKALRAGLRGVDVYTQEEIPEHLHWKNSGIAPPILVVAREGTVVQPAKFDLQRPSSYGGSQIFNGNSRQGLSGYDPEFEDMRGIFMARGPDFKSNSETYPSIELVDVYQLFCALLDIQPQSNDGNWNRVKEMLRNEGSRNAVQFLVLKTTFTCLTILILNGTNNNWII